MRFKTLAPFVFRMAENSDEIIDHIKLEGSTQIFINAQEIHKSKLYWENPEKFDPERFMPSTSNEIKKNSFLAFGGGMRLCPGRNLAMAELKTLLVLLFSRYNVELADYSAPLKTQCTIANHCEELKVKLTRINN
ncbi:5632_t:CDS:1 [Funneliformis geosporum]|uniref:7247_t:CDS:1 n=1 Tax=Funneliformis geosporum TaxID=1117311 RepID=A0A9W4SIR6_9GLOM|nr:5632_t:CDS:1 [Funneliformis geosporum]CAI2171039.1 7247_t:CDS:1 [Funneliformis geosporum]